MKYAGIGFVVGCLLAIMYGLALSDGPSAPVSAAPVSPVPQPTVVAQRPTESLPTTSAQVTTPPVVGIVSGTHEIGTGEYMVAPGKYRTAGPDPDRFGGMCYWARLKDLEGDFSSIISNDNIEGPTTVVIKESDVAFETNGCQPWVKVN